MAGALAAQEFAVWSVTEHTTRVEYSTAVVDQIRMAAVEGFLAVPHGGVEIGGILYGRYYDDRVRIEAWRPIGCAYTKGPSFVLSEKEEEALRGVLRSATADPKLAGLQPVGCYRSHTRSEVCLGDADLSFYQQFFPEAWQVVLIVRPASFRPTRAGFFFRESDGRLRAESSYQEFVLKPLGIPVPAEPPEPAAVREEPAPRVERLADRLPPRETAKPARTPLARALVAHAEAVKPPAPVEPVGAVRPTAPVKPALLLNLAPPVEPPKFLQAPARRNRRWLRYALALLLMAAGAVGFWMYRPVSSNLALSATDKGGQLRIAWDRDAAPIRRAAGGLLEINDQGVQTKLGLTPSDLRGGSISYARQSGNVGVRLVVEEEGGGTVEEITRFLTPGGTAPAATSRQEQPPAGTPTGPQPAPSQDREPIKPAPTRPDTSAQRIVIFRLPKQDAKKPVASIPPIAPPKLDNTGAISGSAVAPPPMLASVPAPTTAPAGPKAAPAGPKTRVTATGRVIWTGKFPKSGRLVIEGSRASAGSVSGALPSGGVRVNAYAGDLTTAGLTLFTSDPKYSRPVTEAPGSQNGWNRTIYTFDRRRAAEVRIVEQPGPQNGYHLVLESDTPKLAIVVVDWRTLP